MPLTATVQALGRAGLFGLAVLRASKPTADFFSELLRENPLKNFIAPLMGWWPAAAQWLEKAPWMPDMRFILYGIILILVIRFRPEGIIPSRSRARELHAAIDREEEDLLSLYNLRHM